MNYFQDTVNPKYPTDKKLRNIRYVNAVLYAVPSQKPQYTRLKTIVFFNTGIEISQGYNPRY